MKVIYHDKLGRHLSIIAAAIHLQLIGDNVSRWDLRQLPYFLGAKSPGTLHYMGLDAQGNEIFVLGRVKSFPIIRNAYLGLNRIFKLNQDFIFVDVQPLASSSVRFFDLLNPLSENRDRKYLYLNGLFGGLEKVRPEVNRLVFEVKKKLLQGEDN